MEKEQQQWRGLSLNREDTGMEHRQMVIIKVKWKPSILG